jgi:hypothetical protein
MIGSNTLSAKNTFAQIPDNEGVCFLQTGIMGHGIEVYPADTQFSGNVPQLASVSPAANDTGLRMIGHHQAYNIYPVGFYGGRVRQKAHIGCNRCDT